MKSVELDTVVPGYTAESLFGVIYGGTGYLQAYHKALNDAQVGEWSDNERSVSFTTPVDAPAFIKRLVGKDVMRVNEQQSRAAQPDGSIQLTSLPVPDMPGGAKFDTQAVFTFSDADGGGCKVHCEVQCSAAGPYGLTGTIEAFMADSAKKSLQEFLAFIPTYLQAPAAAAALAAPAVAAPAGPPPIPVAAGAGAGGAAGWAAEPSEQFFDAPELPLPAFPVAVGGRDGLRFEDAALLYLSYQCRTGDQLVGLLQALELQVRSLQENVAALQAAAQARQRTRRWLPELPETISTRQALLVAALAASASAAAALTYGRRQQAAA